MKLINSAIWSRPLFFPSNPSASVAEAVTRRARLEVVEVELAMQQTELSDQLQSVLHKSERRVEAINYVLAFLLVVTLVWALYAAWRSGQQEKISAINLVPDSVRVMGFSALCPGETLNVRYALDITGEGVIITDDSVERGNETVKFSQSRREIIDHSGRRTYEDSWTIPPQPDMPVEDNAAWIPGQYIRKISVAASNSYVSRYTDPASFSVPFTIRANCAS